MTNLVFLLELTKRLTSIGHENKELPPLNEVEPLESCFTKEITLDYNKLDELDGHFTRREIIARYLLLNVILDQGPDIKGVRELLKNVTNNLYKKEIKIFHNPNDFFKNIDIVIDVIQREHNHIKEKRADVWAKENNTSPNKYNLFFTQSPRGIISIKQILDYVIHRWGSPLSLFIMLGKTNRGTQTPDVLINYIESWKSAEIMCQRIKDHERYGLGSAIGDKACHLYAKMYVSVFNLVKLRRYDNGWTDLSYELPLDSNAARVLFRTGFLNEIASFDDYERWGVIQKGKGKGGYHYIRATNLRHKKINIDDKELLSDYASIRKDYLKLSNKQPQYIEIQHLPNLLIYKLNKESSGNQRYRLSDFDDGLIFIGTKYCFNHKYPKCNECPINYLCKGYKENNSLITNYFT
jgi:hypothetical protein